MLLCSERAKCVRVKSKSRTFFFIHFNEFPHPSHRLIENNITICNAMTLLLFYIPFSQYTLSARLTQHKLQLFMYIRLIIFMNALYTS